MTKLSFLFSLREKLSALPPEETEERLRFYSEMIEDRIEEGLSEEEAVSAVGSVEEIAAQILADMGIPRAAAARKLETQHKKGAFILLLLGSPVWIPLLIAAFAVVFALYVSVWAVIVSFWAVFAAFAGSAAGLVVSGSLIAVNSNIPSGLTAVAVGLILGGLSIFLFYGCKAVTKGTILLTKKIGCGIRNVFRKKEEA